VDGDLYSTQASAELDLDASLRSRHLERVAEEITQSLGDLVFICHDSHILTAIAIDIKTERHGRRLVLGLEGVHHFCCECSEVEETGSQQQRAIGESLEGGQVVKYVSHCGAREEKLSKKSLDCEGRFLLIVGHLLLQ
jgi:hypothetical protein